MLEVKCPVCNTTIKLGSDDKPTIDPRTVNGTAFLIPEKIGCTDSAIWEMARHNASVRYVEENDASWEEADKYAREDYVFAEYMKLKGENDMATKTTGKKTMKGEIKLNKKDQRMEALKAAGFDLDAMAKAGINLEQFIKADETAKEVSKDIFVKRIVTDGYADVISLEGRFVTAAYIRLCGWYDGTSKYDDWTENFNKKYGYQYQFEYMMRELHALALTEHRDIEAFYNRKRFFNKDVVIALCNSYIEELKESLKEYKIKHCKGVPYITYKGVDVFMEDINAKIIRPLQYQITWIKCSESYTELEGCFRNFVKNKSFKKLDFNTRKCPAFVDAYKGRGAYLTAENIIRYSGCQVHLDDGRILDRVESEKELLNRVSAYKGE